SSGDSSLTESVSTPTEVMDSSTTPLQDTSQISGCDSSSIDMDRFSCRSSAYQSASTIRIQPSASSNSDVSLVRSSSIATLVHNASHHRTLGMEPKAQWKGCRRACFC